MQKGPVFPCDELMNLSWVSPSQTVNAGDAGTENGWMMMVFAYISLLGYLH